MFVSCYTFILLHICILLHVCIWLHVCLATYLNLATCILLHCLATYLYLATSLYLPRILHVYLAACLFSLWSPTPCQTDTSVFTLHFILRFCAPLFSCLIRSYPRWPFGKPRAWRRTAHQFFKMSLVFLKLRLQRLVFICLLLQQNFQLTHHLISLLTPHLTDNHNRQSAMAGSKSCPQSFGLVTHA